MKKRHFSILLGLGIICIVLILVVVLTRERPDTFTEGFPQLSLPKGVKMRLGTGTIKDVAYSPKGAVLAVASSIGVWLYDTNTYELIDLIAEHTGRVKSISFSRDGALLASGSEDGTVHIWDIAARNYRQTFTGYGNLGLANSGVEELLFCGNKLLLVHGGVHTDLWDVDKGLHKKHLDWYEVLSPNGEKVANVNSKGVHIRDIGTGERWTLTPPTKDRKGRVDDRSGELFSPNGQMFAAVSEENHIYLWDVNTKAHKKNLRGHKESRIESMAFSADGQILASGDSDATIRLWDVKTGKEKKTLRRHWFPMSGSILRFLKRHLPTVYSLSFSGDGQALASMNSDNTISVWDVSTGKHKKMLRGQALSVGTVAFSPDSKTLVSGGDTVRLWDANTGTHKRIFKGHKRSIERVFFSPKGQTLASISWDDTIRLWDVTTGGLQMKVRYKHNRLSGGWRAASFSPDGQTLVGVGGAYGPIIPDKPDTPLDTKAYLWDISTGRLKKTFNVNKGSDYFVNWTFSPDGKILAGILNSSLFSRNSRAIHLWDINAGTLKQTLIHQTEHITGLVFSPDNKTLVAISAPLVGTSVHPQIILWDVGTGKYKQTFTLPIVPIVGFYRGVLFSPDGKTLACYWGTDIYLWDVEIGRQVGMLIGHTHYIRDVSFSPDGKTLVSTSEDGTILFWDLILHRMRKKNRESSR